MILIVLFASVGCILAIPVDVQVQVTVENVYEENANPEELAGFFEGDIELLPGENPFNRVAVNDPDRLWPGGVVPYVISSTYTDVVKQNIRNYMQEIMDLTMVNGTKCITFQPRKGEAGYIKVKNGTGCHTNYIGYRNREVAVTLGKRCGKGPSIHEILHALGFWHEQSRYDRDEYVTINWNNIQAGRQANFGKHSITEANTLGQPYDYGSIMHYGEYAFADDRNIRTIIPVQDGVFIGQRRGLSPIDIKKIQLLYNCDGTPVSSTTVDPDKPTTPSVPYTASEICTFEVNMCQWTQSPDATMTWHRHNRGTPVANTGPDSDHTGSATAYYIFIKAKTNHNKTAILESREYTGGNFCVDFYYHMYGAGVDSLRLNIVARGAATVLKTWSNNHGNQWKHQLLNVQASETFKFQFEGHIGNNNHGDIALDDIAIYRGDC